MGDKLPDHLAATVTKRMRAAYHADSALAAEAQLEALAKELDRTHPGAAARLREALAETLTVLRLDVSPTLARTLRSTNTIESMISIARTHSTNVKNWQNGTLHCAPSAGLRERMSALAERLDPPRRMTGGPVFQRQMHIRQPRARATPSPWERPLLPRTSGLADHNRRETVDG